MPIIWDERYSQQLDTLSAKFDAIDVDRVVRNGVKETADDIAELVRTKVVEHPDIKSPARLLSPYDHGPGPSMSRSAAWRTSQVGPASFIVEPHPKVRQRAVILEYGTRDPITPQSADALKFSINGVPVYADEVDGIDARGYWRAAMAEARSKEYLTQNLDNEWSDELEKHF